MDPSNTSDSSSEEEEFVVVKKAAAAGSKSDISMASDQPRTLEDKEGE